MNGALRHALHDLIANREERIRLYEQILAGQPYYTTLAVGERLVSERRRLADDRAELDALNAADGGTHGP